MIVSLNYQLLYEFERDIDTNINSKSLFSFIKTAKEKIDFTQSGSLKALAPAFAMEVTPDFSLGFTLQYLDRRSLLEQWVDFENNNKQKGFQWRDVKRRWNTRRSGEVYGL